MNSAAPLTNQSRNVPPTRLSFRGLLFDAASGVGEKPLRSILTMLGTVLGVGAFVAILGLSSTAAGQISQAFSVQDATTVTVTDQSAGEFDLIEAGGTAFPTNSDSDAMSIKGVLAAGRSGLVGSGEVNVAFSINPAVQAGKAIGIASASPGYLEALGATMLAGTDFAAISQELADRVAVLGAGAASQVGASRNSIGRTIFLQGIAYTLIGIIDTVEREPIVLQSVLIPSSTALRDFGTPGPQNPVHLTVKTQLGAAGTVAEQIALALRPDNPSVFRVQTVTLSGLLEGDVLGAVRQLLLGLAGVASLIGAVGIANTSLVAVMERAPEIGLRRTFGARPVHIAVQFGTESAMLGGLGGLLGSALGTVAVVIVSIVRSWTALIDPWVVVLAPLGGLIIGILAGLYPAVRAARLEPIDVLRR